MRRTRGTGIVLLAASAVSSAEWVRRGVVACHVLEHPAWTVVTPADDRSATGEPYDDALTVLASRHVGPRIAPAIGLFVIDDAAVVTAQGGGWRAVKRWALRDRERRFVRGPELPPLRPEDLHRVLASTEPRRRVAMSDLTALWRRTDLTHLEWVIEATRVLGLPGGRVLDGTDDALGPRIAPDARSVGAFESVVKDVTS